MPLTDMVNEVGDDQYGFAERTAFSLNGEWYTFPLYGFPHVVWYRTDLFQEAGLTPPTTWEEMLAVSKALTTDDRYGLVMAMSFVDQDFALQFGLNTNAGFYLDADGNPALIPGSKPYEIFVESLTYLKDLKECCMADGVLTWKQADTRTGWLNDEAAMLVSSTLLCLQYPVG